MQVHRLDVTQVLIYPRDRIPFWNLTSAAALEAIQERFGFEAAEVARPDEDKASMAVFQRGGLVFSLGTGSSDLPAGTTGTPIQYLVIGDGRIEVSAFGDDELLDQFLNEFGGLCAELMPDYKDWIDSFLFRTHDTIWIGQIDIDPLGILHPAWGKVVPEIKRGAASEQFEPTVVLSNFSFRISYLLKDPRLLDFPALAETNEFRLEPRFGAPGFERVWFSRSPLRSDHHLQVLSQIEKAFGDREGGR